MDSPIFTDSKTKEEMAQTFLRHLFKTSGYEVMDYGIETHNQLLIKQLAENYKPDTNRRLLSMPDFVVIDKTTKESWVVEVKSRNFKKYFNKSSTNIFFHYGHIKSYIDFWKDTTLVIVLNVPPYCLCVDIKDINWNRHFIEKVQNKDIPKRRDDSWNFYDIYKTLHEKFPKITEANLQTSLKKVKII